MSKWLVGSNIFDTEFLTSRGHEVEQVLDLMQCESVYQHIAHFNSDAIKYIDFIPSNDFEISEFIYTISVAIFKKLDIHLIGEAPTFVIELSRRCLSIHLYSNLRNFESRNFIA